jgi:hypothetical protein
MTYCYICDGCGETWEVMRSIHADEETQVCGVCSAVMRRDYSAEHTSVRGDYSQPILMQSIAIHPDQVAEHRKLFPKIELKKTPGGFFAPVAHSLPEKRRILKDRGFIDRNAYI